MSARPAGPTLIRSRFPFRRTARLLAIVAVVAVAGVAMAAALPGGHAPAGAGAAHGRTSVGYTTSPYSGSRVLACLTPEALRQRVARGAAH